MKIPTRQSITQSANYKWWVFGTIAIGTFLSVVDHGSVNVALPTMASRFEIDLPTVQWVIIGYTLAICALLLPMGRLADIIGRKQVYVAGFVIFVAAAAMAGFSVNLPMLIIARVLQGVGSAMMQANSTAILISVFPPNERGKVLGTHMSVVGTGAISGPVVGGLLVSYLGWNSVFFIHVPLGIIAIVVTMALLDKSMFMQHTQGGPAAVGGQAGGDSGNRASRSFINSFDWLGAALCAGFLVTFLVVMTMGNRAGWASAPILAGFVGFAAMVAAFVWWELRSPSPMLDLRLFKRRLFAFAVAAGWISFLGTSAGMFMMPFYFQNVLGYSAREAGLFTIPSALMMTIMGPLSGRLSDRYGWRVFNVAGLTISASALFILAAILRVDSFVGVIIPVMMFQSIGTGIFNSPNNSSILSAVERHRYGVVSALTQLNRNSATVTSIAVATAIVVATMASMGFQPSLDAVGSEGGEEVAGAFVSGMQRAWLLLGGMLVVGVVLSFFKGDRAKEEPEETPAKQAQPGVGEGTSA